MDGCNKNLLLESEFKDPKKEAEAAARSLNGHPGTWEQTDTHSEIPVEKNFNKTIQVIFF